MHEPTPADCAVLRDIGDWVLGRLGDREQTLPPRPPRQLEIGFTDDGVGIERIWHDLRDDLLPTAAPTDHPRYLAFIGGSASVAAVLADMAISSAGIYAGTSFEAGALVAAERAAARWLCDLVGLPDGAHGTFVSGGTTANLSALVAARKSRRAGGATSASIFITGSTAHASVRNAAEIMDSECVAVGRPDRPLRAADVAAALETIAAEDVVAVVASAGATNTGTIDELDELAQLCSECGLWLHVDAAYGGAAMLSARTRPLFRGIGRADSVTVDPHKWLFTPFDCGAVLYRDPELARRAHRQTAHYLEAANTDTADNPADYAVHLSRRARGIPFWASLRANGVEAYRDAVERCLDVATYAAKQLSDRACLELVTEPSLSILLFRRVGWQAGDYEAWSRRALATGLGVVTPTRYNGETVLRFCFVNPLTSERDVDLLLDALSVAQGAYAGGSEDDV